MSLKIILKRSANECTQSISKRKLKIGNTIHEHEEPIQQAFQFLSMLSPLVHYLPKRQLQMLLPAQHQLIPSCSPNSAKKLSKHHHWKQGITKESLIPEYQGEITQQKSEGKVVNIH